MKVAAFGLAAGLAFGLAGACLANDFVAAEQLSGTNVGFVLKGSYSNATLTVAGPNDFYVSTFSKGGAVAIDLSRHGPVVDGVYNYQLSAAGTATVGRRKPLADGRDDARRTSAYAPAAKSGSFSVRGGRIVDYGAAAEATERDRDSR